MVSFRPSDTYMSRSKNQGNRLTAGGFDPHIDANAYTHVKMIKHLTVLAAVDGMSAENGGLEVVDGSHLMEIKLGADRCIEPSWVQSQKWTSCDLQPGRSNPIPNQLEIISG